MGWKQIVLAAGMVGAVTIGGTTVAGAAETAPSTPTSTPSTSPATGKCLPAGADDAWPVAVSGR
ncbi:MAG: hypothetical protein JWO77_3467, partial [Ilumatobacteraceae bacterium]|nr:hypothetical protein [Ilumatobacteraceae bacterium]